MSPSDPISARETVDKQSNENRRARQATWPGRLMFLAKIVIVILVIVFIAKAISDSREDFRNSDFSLSNMRWEWIAVAWVAYPLGMLPMAANWSRLLEAMGQTPPWGATVRAHFISQLGKYVPGKASVVFIRLGLLRPHRLDMATTVLSAVAETLTMMSIGAVLAGFVLVFHFWQRPEIAGLCALMALVAGLPTIPPVLRLAIRWMQQRRFSTISDDHYAGRLTWRVLATGWLGVAGGWLVLGISMWATMRALNLPTTRNLPITHLPWVTASYAISVVSGFLSMLPGGVAVRETVMANMLEPEYGKVAAILAPAMHRMISLVSELLVSGILYFGGRLTRVAPATHDSSPERQVP